MIQAQINCDLLNYQIIIIVIIVGLNVNFCHFWSNQIYRAIMKRFRKRTHPLFDPVHHNFREVRRTIIEYAIQAKRHHTLSYEMVKNCRLVSKDWLDITGEILTSSRQPLFHLTLDMTRFLNGTCYYDGVRGVKKLVLDFGNPVGEKPAPINVKVVPQCFQRFKNQDILDQLQQASNILTSLDIVVNQTDIKQGKLFTLNNLQLPKLKICSIEFTKDNSDVKFKLESVFQACPNLQNLKLPCGKKVFEDIVLPPDFASILLPANLTFLELSTKLESQHLKVLEKSSLPNLRSLILLIHRDPFERGLVCKVLENVRCSLEYLFIQGEGHDGSPEPPTYFNFPVMEKLHKLHLESQHFELEPGSQSLEKFLPKLKIMKLMLQTKPMLERWTKSESKLASVQKLYATMTDEDYSESDPEYHLTLEPNDMKNIANTFTNLRALSVQFWDNNLDCLEVVFSELPLLERLDIFIDNIDLVDEDKWTSALLAVPPNSVPDLKDERNVLDLVNDHPSRQKSIRNLTNLNTLAMTCNWDLLSGRGIIVDSVFRVAFLQMPKLQRIIVSTDTLVSKHMKEEWKSKGRTFEVNFEKCFDSEIFS